MLAPGSKLGPYDIQAAIGAGGMGEVYRARDARLNRDVAIKILPASFSKDADATGANTEYPQTHYATIADHSGTAPATGNRQTTVADQPQETADPATPPRL